MLIKLIIISVMLLPNGFIKKTTEVVVGYTTIEQCVADKDLVSSRFKNTATVKLIAVNCVNIGEM